MEQANVFFTTIPYEDHFYQACGVVDEKNKLCELQLTDPSNPSLVGNIYLARVLNVLMDMQCAFVLLNQKTTAYLPFDSCDHVLHVDEELLVQVTTDALKTKFAVVTQFYEISSTHCCLVYGAGSHGVSKKLSRKDRETWKVFLSQYDKTHYHFLLRTNVMECDQKELTKELEELQTEAEELERKGAHATCFSLLYQQPPNYIPMIRRYQSIYEEQVKSDRFCVITDDESIYKMLCEECKKNAFSLPIEQLKLYRDDSYPLYKLYALSNQIDKLLHKTVWLDSGANILIESMETLTAIDVNSAKKQGKKNKSNQIYAMNLEAAKEIARQIRLRNISGMILIDFINMEDEKKREDLIRAMKSFVKYDTNKVNVIDITKLGLMELTREKISKSLKQTLKNS